MSFAENLKTIRHEKNLSQEQLAELLNVSRQAVSKWEQDGGYPETENLIQIAQKLDVSLDMLLLDKQLTKDQNSSVSTDILTYPISQKIAITFNDGKTQSLFYKFRISSILFAKQGKPKYLLSGTDRGSFLGDNLVELGWYLTKEDAEKELKDIKVAIENGESTYELKHNTDVKPGFFNIINNF